MAHLIKEEDVLSLSIFVILFPKENCFFVWKTESESLKQAYKNHFYCQRKKTKALFAKARKENTVPPMYCLETRETTQKEAFYRCVAWAKYFMNHGYTSCCGNFLDQYTVDLKDESKGYFATIKDRPLAEVCPDGEDLFPNFGRQKVSGKEPSYSSIHFRIKPEEYQQIKAAAVNTSLTITEYCKKMVLNGRVIEVSPEVFGNLSTYLDSFVARDKLLKSILAAIYSTKTYYPVDLDIIQKAIQDNSEQHIQAIEATQEMLNLLLDKESS